MRLLFKLFVIMFLINIINILCSFIFLIYKYSGLFTINNFFIEDLFIFSTLMIFPLSGIILIILSKPFNL